MPLTRATRGWNASLASLSGALSTRGWAGLTDPDRYSSHSTRRGFAAELRRHGASDLEIAAAGGWQRLDQVRRYATSAAIWHDPPAARLGL
jgi:hypothetical protein